MPSEVEAPGGGVWRAALAPGSLDYARDDGVKPGDRDREGESDLRHTERSRGTWEACGAPPGPPGPSTTLL